MNYIYKIVWLLLNIFFGAFLATILFVWIACDMTIPEIGKDFVATYFPILYPIFNMPYVHIDAFSSSLVGKLLFNGFLYAIFGFCHTLFAQEFVHNILGRYIFPRQTLRTIYCMIVSATVFVIIGFWQYTHIQLWNWLPTTMDIYQRQAFLLILNFSIFAPGLYVVIKFNPLEFCGVKQIFTKTNSSGCPFATSSKNVEKRSSGNETLITTGLFRLCRHPLYLFTISSWILTPVMSLDRLAIIIYTFIYAAIAVPIEEQKLISIFGQAYKDYQMRVPAIIPFLRWKIKTQ